MKQIRTEIEIGAVPEQVWKVLTDFAAFPTWNPFMRSAEGELKTGARLKVYIRPKNGMGMTIKPTVLKAEPNHELRWLGRLLMPGLFDGEHFFIIEPLGEGQVRFVHGERFTGILIPLLVLMGLFKNTLRGFEEMNQALKVRAEGAVEGEAPAT